MRCSIRHSSMTCRVKGVCRTASVCDRKGLSGVFRGKASVKILRLFSSGAGRGYSKQFTAQGVHRRKLYRRIKAV